MDLKLLSLIIIHLCFLRPITAQIIDTDWNKDELIENQMLKFANGNIWIKNLLVNDTLWRQEFSTCGELKVNAQITQLSYGDSLITFDEEVYEEYLNVTYFVKDVPDGEFTMYFDNGIIKEKGHYANGIKIGKWETYYASGEVWKVTHYNRKGHKEGNFVAYYRNGNIKVNGQYAIEKIVKKTTWYDTETYELYEAQSVFESAIKKGEWQYFSKHGTLKDHITYH